MNGLSGSSESGIAINVSFPSELLTSDYAAKSTMVGVQCITRTTAPCTPTCRTRCLADAHSGDLISSTTISEKDFEITVDFHKTHGRTMRPTHHFLIAALQTGKHNVAIDAIDSVAMQRWVPGGVRSRQRHEGRLRRPRESTPPPRGVDSATQGSRLRHPMESTPLPQGVDSATLGSRLRHPRESTPLSDGVDSTCFRIRPYKSLRSTPSF